MIGQTISHYKILEKLGEGGMGVVYKAHDTQLDRDVALKFLPAHVSVSEETKARFLQEAKAAAALNHAHICTIHGVEEDGGQVFIVMECIEGGTLREKLPFSKVNDALSIAIQIGEALQEAHSKGIVHRDIKADNVMLTSKGQAKVMDFGLAKLKGSLKLTKTSSTVGTLAYMAPEQIQGGEVDARSDIFSFGVLLFEMLTGRTPFRGEHEAAMVYSIVNEAAEPIQKYRPEISSEVVHVLEKALEKDPADRFQSTADMVVDLRRALKQSSRLSGAAVSGAYRVSTPQVESISPKPSQRNLLLGIAGLAVLIVLVVGYFLLKSNASTSISRLNQKMKESVLPIPFSQVSYAGISKDGKWIAFPAPVANTKWDNYYMHISSGDLRCVTTDSCILGSGLQADISPDQSKIVYKRYKPNGVSQICITSVFGGAVTILSDTCGGPRWRPDGQRIGFVRIQRPSRKAYYNFWSIKPDGSDSRLEFADTLGRWGRYSFAWSPNGQSVAWIRTFQQGYQEIVAIDLASGKERQLTRDERNIDDVCWTRNDMIVFSSNRAGNTNLWMIPVEGGTPQQITNGSGPDVGISMSDDGQKLLYLQQQPVSNVWIANTDGSSAQQVTDDAREIPSASLSPDGKQIALAMRGVDPLKPSVHLYVQDRNGNGANRRQITTGDIIVRYPRWSPDGKWIAFSKTSVTGRTESAMASRTESASIHIVDAANPREPRSIISGDNPLWLNWNTLVTSKPDAGSNEEITLDGGPPHQVLEDSTQAFPVASGRKVLYWDRHKGKEGVWMISPNFATNALKSRPRRLFRQDEIRRADITSSFLYYWNQSGELWRLNYLTESKERLKGPFPGLEAGSVIAVRGDDKEFVYISFRASGKLVLIENLFQ